MENGLKFNNYTFEKKKDKVRGIKVNGSQGKGVGSEGGDEEMREKEKKQENVLMWRDLTIEQADGGKENTHSDW